MLALTFGAGSMYKSSKGRAWLSCPSPFRDQISWDIHILRALHTEVVGGRHSDTTPANCWYTVSRHPTTNALLHTSLPTYTPSCNQCSTPYQLAHIHPILQPMLHSTPACPHTPHPATNALLHTSLPTYTPSCNQCSTPYRTAPIHPILQPMLYSILACPHTPHPATNALLHTSLPAYTPSCNQCSTPYQLAGIHPMLSGRRGVYCQGAHTRGSQGATPGTG